jgi:nucleoside-diphosphate-sugar epimerase
MADRPHTLITGGAGMIGSNLARRLVAAGHRVSVVDNLWRGRREYLAGADGEPVIDMDNDFHELDLMVPGIMDGLLDGVDHVYHLADVVAGIGFVFAHQGYVFRQNLLINSNVIESVRRHPVSGFVYVGTACSFPQEKQSGVDAAPLREEDIYPAHPESAYGWSKLMGEYESFLLEQETGVPVSVLSLHNVFGPPCDFSEQNSQVIPSLIRKAIEWPSQPFSVWGSGAQGRAFVFTEDVVDALVAALDKGLGQGVIQVGPDGCTTIREVAQTVVAISGKDIDIQFDTSKPEGDRGRCADYSKARRVLGWNPTTTLRDGLAATSDWIAARV